MSETPGDYAALFEHVNAVIDDSAIPTLHVIKQVVSDNISASVSATPEQISIQTEMRPTHFLSGGFSASTDLASQASVKLHVDEGSLTLTEEFSPEYDKSIEDAYYGRRGELKGFQHNTRAELEFEMPKTSTSVLFNERGRIGAISSLTRLNGPAESLIDVGFEHVNVGSRAIRLSAAGVRASWRNYIAVAEVNSTRTAAAGVVAQFKRFAMAGKVQASEDDVEAQLGIVRAVGNGQVSAVLDSQRNIALACRCLLGDGELEVKGSFKINGESACAVQWVI